MGTEVCCDVNVNILSSRWQHSRGEVKFKSLGGKGLEICSPSAELSQPSLAGHP